MDYARSVFWVDGLLTSKHTVLVLHLEQAVAVVISDVLALRTTPIFIVELTEVFDLSNRRGDVGALIIHRTVAVFLLFYNATAFRAQTYVTLEFLVLFLWNILLLFRRFYKD